jgi:hypothetical protein
MKCDEIDHSFAYILSSVDARDEGRAGLCSTVRTGIRFAAGLSAVMSRASRHCRLAMKERSMALLRLIQNPA